jgi:hypothetical protein
MGNDSEKSEGLKRAESRETNSQKLSESGDPYPKKPGPAYGGSKSGNPTSGGKIRK